ncbi:DUF3189 family protein [Rossellomorea sp. DUT-2]|uniref:DUF3189 family protein n=1 Tax=Rossellomorea sp. DUT-2 TaxID=3412021 RepID=UPI003D178EDB
MIYIYNDFGGTHTTSLAAAYHLHILKPSHSPLTKNDILNIPYFNQLTKKEAGQILFRGMDEENNPVYTIGRRSSKYVVPALTDLSNILLSRYGEREKIIISNTSPTVPPLMTAGGFLSRELGIDSIGVPLLVKGAQQCHDLIYYLVTETKQVAKASHEQVVVLENEKYQYKIGKKDIFWKKK